MVNFFPEVNSHLLVVQHLELACLAYFHNDAAEGIRADIVGCQSVLF